MRLVVCSMFLSACVLAARAFGQPNGSVPFPHPLITEVLYAVPGGPKGDANGDGARDAVGDEFIELVNPHDRPIQLKGYVLMDSDAYAPGAPKTEDPPTGGAQPGGSKPGAAPTGGGKSDRPARKPKPGNEQAQVKFVFPDLELKPGQVVVVFNGYHQKIAGPVGDANKAAGTNEKFHDAYVFTMNNESPYAALGNDADFVLLQSPEGKVVHVVKWGRTDKNPPKDAILVEDAPASVGSVQRDGVHGKLVAHKDLKGDLAGTLFSPGVFSLTPGTDTPHATTPSTPTNPKGHSGTGGRQRP